MKIGEIYPLGHTRFYTLLAKQFCCFIKYTHRTFRSMPCGQRNNFVVSQSIKVEGNASDEHFNFKDRKGRRI